MFHFRTEKPIYLQQFPTLVGPSPLPHWQPGGAPARQGFQLVSSWQLWHAAGAACRSVVTCMLGQTGSRDPGSQSVRLAAPVIAAKLRTGDQILVSSSASLSKFAPKFRRGGDQYLVSEAQKYIDFDISGLRDRYIDLHDGLRIESPLLCKEVLVYFSFFSLNYDGAP